TIYVQIQPPSVAQLRLHLVVFLRSDRIRPMSGHLLLSPYPTASMDRGTFPPTPFGEFQGYPHPRYRQRATGSLSGGPLRSQTSRPSSLFYQANGFTDR